MSNQDIQVDTEVAVLGSGPGGYTAAFRAADLGKKTVLIERYPSLGGVCLNVGCIPSKALLHVAKVICEANEIQQCGVLFQEPEVDIQKLRKWVDKVVGQLTGGLGALAKQRGVQVITGHGQFIDGETIRVVHDNKVTNVSFRDAIIAAGSSPTSLPFLPDDPRIVNSTGALSLENVPERLLVIGGGIIGLELGTVYHELGSKITVVEVLDNLIAEADADITKPLLQRVKKQYENILLKTRVVSVSADKEKLTVNFESDKGSTSEEFDMILTAVGRSPNGNLISASSAGVQVDNFGFIPVDRQQRTNVDGIYAIGDITGQPMLAHKATHQGKVAAEVIAGIKSGFDTSIIPSVAYTDPEIAWVGLTEKEAKKNDIPYEKGVFPWRASGRALSMSRSEGVTKLLFDPESKRLIGAGIVGVNAGELITETALAIEMGADAADLALTIHPHPTLSETVCFAAEAYEGTITDLYLPKKSAKQRR